MPVLIGLGAKWSARAEIDQLRATNAALQVENGSYRAATGELTDADSVARKRHQRPRRARAARSRAGCARCRSCPRSCKSRAAGGGIAAERRDFRASSSAAALDARGHVRRAARPAARPREPAALCAARRRAAGRAGGRDAVDLAGARLADRHVRRPQRSVHAASRRSIRASTSRPRRASRSSPPRTASSSRPPTPATTAISSSCKHDFGLATRYGHLSAFA